MSDGLINKSASVISIIIPVFRDVGGLMVTVGSIRKQTAAPSLYEILVANDGGDAAVKKYCEAENITCLNIIPNKGSYNARNEAISKSSHSAQYLAFIDADIVADKDWIKNGLIHLQQNDYVAGDIKIPHEQVNDIATFHDYLTAFPIRSYFEEHGFGVTGNLFLRKTVIEKIGAFNSSLLSGGDLEFGNRANFDASIKKVFAPDCLLFHSPRNHLEKITKMKRVKQGHKTLLKMDPHRFSFLEKNKAGLKLLLPPRWSTVEEIYLADEKFSKWQLYVYLYKLRLSRLLLV